MKNILITGGSGYIGSHTCLPLLEKGYKLTVIDSNVNSSQLSIERVRKIKRTKLSQNKISFFKGDLRDETFLNNIFLKAIEDSTPIDAVIHFAGLKSVSESFSKPFLYWDNNVMGSLCLLKNMEKYDCRNIVFSSSASIYGYQFSNPILETSEIKPLSPYAYTKVSIENMLSSIFKSFKDSWKIANLRYFNPIGAHESGFIGENSLSRPTNIFPLICKVAQGKLKELEIFGSNWPTKDGTCIRDYIHIMDLAEAHSLALEFISRNKPQIIDLNIGTGIGTSVLELVNNFGLVNKCSIPYRFVERRLGDSSYVVADNNKAKSILDWKPKRNIADMCKDGWNWQKLNPNGF